MNNERTLATTSLLSILLMSFHLADDIVRGIEPGGLSNYIGVLILVVWLYGTLVLAARRAGYALMLLGSVGGAAVPAIHMMGTGLVAGRIANSGGKFFWVWTLIALGVTSVFSAMLAARGLWSLRSERSRQSHSGGLPK